MLNDMQKDKESKKKFQNSGYQNSKHKNSSIDIEEEKYRAEIKKTCQEAREDMEAIMKILEELERTHPKKLAEE